jgi:hypothetical protein
MYERGALVCIWIVHVRTIDNFHDYVEYGACSCPYMFLLNRRKTIELQPRLHVKNFPIIHGMFMI